jgi:hypothetical protein
MLLLAFGLAVAVPQLPQQSPQATVAVGDTSPFRSLRLPAPNEIREGSGRPGPGYWQQRASYVIRATLDTAAQAISGDERIRYQNNSPDTLTYVWLQLDQNIYRQRSRGSWLFPENTRWGAEGFEGGITVDSLAAVRASGRGGRGAGERVSLAATVNGTMMRVDLDRPLAPHAALDLTLAFRFPIPEHGSDRMGRERFPAGWLYEIAQWYPRLAVYDDVRGWNTAQYMGQGEFYLEYGDFDVALTVPRGFVVAATGRLANPEEVLTPQERARLAVALHADTTVAIIPESEAGSPATRPAGSTPTLTWHFEARNVRDVAWAAAPNFIWDASGWDGILMQSFYTAPARAAWRHSTAYVRFVIRHYSTKWFRYPYDVATNVAGPVEGMEYPTIVFCSDGSDARGLFGVTAHELGHQWFPMTVGSNERLYPWMDEGFNTFMNVYAARAFYHDTTSARGQMDQLAHFMASGHDLPAIVPADRVPPVLLGVTAYFKPAAGLYLLRHVIVDSTRFDAAFREYIRRWAFRHPTPADFFRTMNDALGEDLSWFWRGWFLTTGRVDLAVDSATATDSAGAYATRIFLRSPGSLPMPVPLLLTFADSTTERVRLPVEVWYLGDRYVLRRPFPKRVTRVEVDPAHVLPDVDRGNNVWVGK